MRATGPGPAGTPRGRTLAALQSAYQVGTRNMWRRLGEGDGAETPRGVIFSLAEALSPTSSRSPLLGGRLGRRGGQRAGSLQARRHACEWWPAPAGGGCRGRAGGRGRRLDAADPDGRAGRAGRGGSGGPAAGRSALTWTRSRWRWFGAGALQLARTAPGRWPVGPPCWARWWSRRRRTVDRAGAGGWPLQVAGLLRPGSADPGPRREHCWRCCGRRAELTATCTNGRWPRCGRCRRRGRASGEQTLRAWSRRTATWAMRRPRCTCTRRTVRYGGRTARAVRGRVGRPAARLELTIALQTSPPAPVGPGIGSVWWDL